MKPATIFLSLIAAASSVSASDKNVVSFYYDANCQSFAGNTPINAAHRGVKGGPWGSNSAKFLSTEGLSDWQFLYIVNSGERGHKTLPKPSAGLCVQTNDDYGLYFTVVPA